MANHNRVAGALQPSDSPAIETLFNVKLACINFMKNLKNALMFYLKRLHVFLKRLGVFFLPQL
jgi:hypothetical protein